MQVVNESSCVLFEDIEVGECFTDSFGNICMKTAPITREGYNSVDIETGKLQCYSSNALVEKINAILKTRR